MSRVTSCVLLVGTLALGACAVAPPTGPSVAVMPSDGKNLQQFNAEDAACRQYASQQIGYASPAQAANQSAVGSAVIGTGVGAAAGALLGAASGNAGAGAAIGAGTGLLFGSAVGADNAQASSASLQQRYDISYEQCMTSKGNKVPPVAEAQPVYAAPGYYPYPAYYAPPPVYVYPPVGVGVEFGYGYHHYHPWGY